MYVLYSRTRGAFLYRSEKVEPLRAICNLEVFHMHTHIFEETNLVNYDLFSINALRDMFSGLTGGTDPHSFNREYLVGQIVRLLQTAPVMDFDEFELTVQCLQVKPKDLNFYQYVKGLNRPRKLEEGYQPPALLGNWEAAQALPIPTGQTAQPTPVAAPAITQSWAVVPCATPPKYAPPWA